MAWYSLRIRRSGFSFSLASVTRDAPGKSASSRCRPMPACPVIVGYRSCRPTGVRHTLPAGTLGPHRIMGTAVDSLYSRHRSEEHTSELQSLMRISYAVFCLKKKKNRNTTTQRVIIHIETKAAAQQKTQNNISNRKSHI